MNLTKPVKIGIAIITGLLLLGVFRLTTVKRIPANTVLVVSKTPHFKQGII